MDPLEKKDELISLFKYLTAFIKNPIESIKSIPRMPISTLFIFQLILCTFSVWLSNILAPYAINITQVLVTTVSSIIGLTIMVYFFHYYFSIIYERQLKLELLFPLVLFANFPFALLHLFYYYFPIADLVGLMISCALMIIGLVENFQIPKKIAIQTMGAVFAITTGLWIYGVISLSEFKEMAKPHQLDSIEREIQSEFE